MIINPFLFPVAGGGPSLIASTIVGGGASGVTSSGIDTTGANFIVVGVVYYNLGTPSSPALTDNKSNTWTALTSQTAATGKTLLYYCFGPTVGSGHTFSFGGNNVYSSIAVSAWSGIATSPFDVENGATNNVGTSLSTGSITPSQNNTLLISCLGDTSIGTISINSGFTISGTVAYSAGNFYGLSMAYKVLSAIAATNPQWSTTGAGVELLATIASFKY